MRTFQCACSTRIFFDNSQCTNCQRELGFISDALLHCSLEPQGEFFQANHKTKNKLYKKCYNYTQHQICNWMIPSDSPEVFCLSCRLDTVIPDLTLPENVELWHATEEAKRRLIYTLLSLNLPVKNRQDDPEKGLSFKFLADGPTPDTKVLTGHDKGLITLNIAEANDAEREKRRLAMHEPYRTLLGHFRHEIGHYYWDVLVDNSKNLEPFRKVFGDERTDYDAALKKYYASDAPSNWQENYISVYATAHPWEDWAETWAHYLHIQDTLEAALNFHLLTDPSVALEPKKIFWLRSDKKSFKDKMKAWADLVVALNSINRSMGLKDIYPFVLSDVIEEKLRFISELITQQK